tara:strand:+ start:166 stop:492 length:327 start_codon:yes stop_codon:yes gene_type:complete
MGWIYIYWKDLNISKFKYSTKEKLYLSGKNFIENNIRENKSIGLQIKVFNHFIEQIYNRKINKLGIRKTDHQIVLQSVMALLVLKQYDEDDLLWFPPIYRRTKSIKTY